MYRRHDLIVIGCGYWGAATAWEAELRELDVVVLDSKDPQSGSRNASGIVHPSIYTRPMFKKFLPADWTQAELDASFEWLRDHCGADDEQEHFTNWSRPDLGVRRANKGLYIPSNEAVTALVSPIQTTVRSVERVGNDWVVNETWRAPRLVVAAGIGTDDVLRLAGAEPVGVSGLFGRGLLVRGTPRYMMPLVIQTRVYRKFETRQWGASPNYLRVGDTAEVKPNAVKYSQELRSVAEWLAHGIETVRWFEGWRPVCEQFTVKLAAPGLVAATGGHRLGLGVSGLVAQRALKLLF